MALGTTSTVQEPAVTQTNTHSETPQSLKTWWLGFKRRAKKEETQKVEPEQPAKAIFGVPLVDSIRYANVAISVVANEGEQPQTYGYVPIVVAKCGVFLKEKATDVEGIFRLSGAAKRIKELQQIFDTPDRYGRGLNWTGYTVHDAANVLRRYLNNLPSPIIPLEFYDQFREPIRGLFDHPDGVATWTGNESNHATVIETYQKLISQLPPLNRQLLLYILDLLAVFASKADINLMTSANLAAIFQPGVLQHPTHDMNPEAYRLSQDVLIFLIDNQDSFLMGMGGPADQKTVEENHGGSVTKRPSTPSRSGIGRTPSIGSNATGEGKRFSGIRRNVSTSSRNSRQSSQGPATPLSERFGGSAVNRSNTLPTRKSPGLASTRFNRGLDSPNTPTALTPMTDDAGNRPLLTPTGDELDTSPLVKSTEGLGVTTTGDQQESPVSAQKQVPAEATSAASEQHLSPPPKSRSVTDVLLNLAAGTSKDGRQPNKLQKKRVPSNLSGNSSAASLVAPED